MEICDPCVNKYWGTGSYCKIHRRKNFYTFVKTF